jgi:hypothetical protein
MASAVQPEPGLSKTSFMKTRLSLLAIALIVAAVLPSSAAQAMDGATSHPRGFSNFASHAASGHMRSMPSKRLNCLSTNKIQSNKKRSMAGQWVKGRLVNRDTTSRMPSSHVLSSSRSASGVTRGAQNHHGTLLSHRINNRFGVFP